MQPAMKNFDTLQATKSIEKAGLERPVAEAISETIAQVQSGLATKADVTLLKGDIAVLQADVNRLEQKTDERFAGLEQKTGETFSGLEQRMDERFASLEQKMDERFTNLGQKMDREIAHLTERIDAQAKLADAQHEGLMRTLKVAMAIMIPIITGNFLAVVGILAKAYVGG